MNKFSLFFNNWKAISTQVLKQNLSKNRKTTAYVKLIFPVEYIFLTDKAQRILV